MHRADHHDYCRGYNKQCGGISLAHQRNNISTAEDVEYTTGIKLTENSNSYGADDNSPEY